MFMHQESWQQHKVCSKLTTIIVLYFILVYSGTGTDPIIEQGHNAVMFICCLS